MYPTNYFSHDAEYQRRRASGNPGWQNASALEEHLALLEQTFRAPNFPQTGKLLELGCGAGDFSLWAAKRGYEVHGVDISPVAIQWALEKAGQRSLPMHLEVGNVLDLSRYASNSFDIVLDGHCCHCIIGDDRAQFLRETFRVLKSGGAFHVNTMCGNPGCEEHRQQFDFPSRCLIQDGIAVRYLGLPADIKLEIIRAGFTVINQRILPRRDDKELDLLLLDATKA